jgi:hypothetical protein
MRSKFAPAKQVNDDSAPGRDRLAGTLLVYSVQRRRAVALARRTEFEPASVFGGLWKIPLLHRKTAAMRAHRGLDPGSHVVPLPPSAWAVVKRAMSLARDSEFLLLAAARKRRDASPGDDHPSELADSRVRFDPRERNRTISDEQVEADHKKTGRPKAPGFGVGVRRLRPGTSRGATRSGSRSCRSRRASRWGARSVHVERRIRKGSHAVLLEHEGQPLRRRQIHPVNESRRQRLVGLRWARLSAVSRHH